MKVSLNLIRKYVDLPEGLTDEQIAYDMTLRTVEVEEVENTAKKFHDIVVGEILEIKEHPNADKLLVSQIDVGEETPRQIVSGIADVYSPEEFVGKKVIVVTNLKPAKLRGVESQGMVLAGGDKKVLGVVDAGELPVGTTIR